MQTPTIQTGETMKKPKHTTKASTPSPSDSVKRLTRRSRSGRGYTSFVGFRLSRGVAVLLRESVPNVSGFLRKVVCEAVEKLPVYFSMEEFKLEVEIALLADELEKVHRWQSLVLKHGSYAEAYLEKLKGGLVQDRRPHFLPEPPPFVKPEEIVVVEDIVKYREKLARQLLVKVNRVMQLKNASLPAEESLREYAGKKKRSKSRGHMTKKPAIKGGEKQL